MEPARTGALRSRARRRGLGSAICDPYSRTSRGRDGTLAVAHDWFVIALSRVAYLDENAGRIHFRFSDGFNALARMDDSQIHPRTLASKNFFRDAVSASERLRNFSPMPNPGVLLATCAWNQTLTPSIQRPILTFSSCFNGMAISTKHPPRLKSAELAQIGFPCVGCNSTESTT